MIIDAFLARPLVPEVQKRYEFWNKVAGAADRIRTFRARAGYTEFTWPVKLQ